MLWKEDNVFFRAYVKSAGWQVEKTHLCVQN